MTDNDMAIALAAAYAAVSRTYAEPVSPINERMMKLAVRESGVMEEVGRELTELERALAKKTSEVEVYKERLSCAQRAIRRVETAVRSFGGKPAGVNRHSTQGMALAESD